MPLQVQELRLQATLAGQHLLPPSSSAENPGEAVQTSSGEDQLAGSSDEGDPFHSPMCVLIQTQNDSPRVNVADFFCPMLWSGRISSISCRLPLREHYFCVCSKFPALATILTGLARQHGSLFF